MTDRLTKSDWIRHGLRTLANDGPNALKVGSMAEGLKVSRGSFYWHFRDVDDFRLQILRSWREHTTEQVIQETAKEAEPDRLSHLLRRAFVGRSSLERAVRSWAAEDEVVATTVASVDASRVTYITKVLVGGGVDSEKAGHRAAFMYWAYIGQMMVMDSGNSSISASAMDDISDLFEK